MTIPVGLLMALCIAGAFIAVSAKNVLHAVFGLAIALLAVGGMFLYLGSPFVATMEVLIYVGGISVAMVFAVMLSQAISSVDEGEGWVRRVLGLIPAVAFLAMIVPILTSHEAAPAPELFAAAWSVEPSDAPCSPTTTWSSRCSLWSCCSRFLALSPSRSDPGRARRRPHDA